MAASIDSTTSTNASSYDKPTATWQRTTLMLAAWFEIIVGVSFIFALNTQSQFLFETTTEGPGVHFARLAGIALIALGITCLPSTPAGTHQAVRTLLIFNIAATILFAWVALTTTFRGVMLWPVVIMHAVIAIALALSSRKERP